LNFFRHKFFRFFASVRTGIFLLLTVILLSAVGTVILQRPITDPVEIQRAYSPSTLQLLDRLQLTDIYHAWYFVTLLGLVILSIIFVSIDRWPNAWRFYSRPYRFAEPHFRASLPTRTVIPVPSADGALDAAERAFKKCGIPVEREVSGNDVGLYSERSRIAEFAVYFVHASLIFLLLGYLLDLQVGYRGTMALNEGETTNHYTIRRGATEIDRTLPFSIRCDGADWDSYKDADGRDTGMPKRYWSKLVVVKNGQDVRKKEIIVNDPLTYAGVRFYQSGMDKGNKLGKVSLQVNIPGAASPQSVELIPNQAAKVGDMTIAIARFVPEYYIQDGEVFTKSETPRNPAMQFTVSKAGTQYPVWIFMDRSGQAIEKNTGVQLTVTGGKLSTLTVLQVSYQPGQFLIFPGVLLMVAGLMMVLLMAHTRHWAVVVNDPKVGPAIWIGGTSNRNKIRFQQKFEELVAAIKTEVKAGSSINKKTTTPELAKV